MLIVEIAALGNGAHRNQMRQSRNIPQGWAMVPEDMRIPDTFPFVDIEVEGQVVTRMNGGVTPEPEIEPTAQEDTDAMLVDHEYRLILLELGVF